MRASSPPPCLRPSSFPPPLHLQILLRSLPFFPSSPSPYRLHCLPSSSSSSSSMAASPHSPPLDERYSSSTLLRKGSGVAIVWFRNDLRLVDNEVFYRAWSSSEALLPVYCVDPRLFGTTHHFGFPKTGDLRAQFILEGLHDLRRSLQKRGLDLYVEHGKPENVLSRLSVLVSAHTIFAQKETCSEEIATEKHVRRNLEKINIDSKEFNSGTSDRLRVRSPKLELVWGKTMYHIDDLPFTAARIPDVYTQFRKSVESQSRVRPCFKVPVSLAPPPKEFLVGDAEWGKIPTLEQLGLQQRDQSHLGVMKFIGGETAAFERLYDYFWEKDKLRFYKETRNGMLGADYSTKFSSWLAAGFISPRLIYEEVKRYEKQRTANDSTYWVLFELIWRDYFCFLSIKYGNAIFHLGGPRMVNGIKWSQNKELFECWRTGSTG